MIQQIFVLGQKNLWQTLLNGPDDTKKTHGGLFSVEKVGVIS